MLVVLSDLCKENYYCKTASLNACGLLLLLWTNLEHISRILIFADPYLPRNYAKIGRRENFPFYGTRHTIQSENLGDGQSLSSCDFVRNSKDIYLV